MNIETLARRQEELKAELATVQEELHETTMSMKRLDDRKMMLLKLKEEQQKLRADMDAATARIEQSDMKLENAEDIQRLQKMQMVFLDKSAQIDKEIAMIEKEIASLSAVEKEDSRRKYFDKRIALANIRELVKNNPDVKLGQIERESGNTPGYMSRLEKEGSTADPSMEFIATAAKFLDISVDALISVNLIGLTPTEQYIVKFFDKLKKDTLEDKLDWNREASVDLNCIETDMNGYCDHPLFDLETFYEEGETEYPEKVTRVVFKSKTFGPTTAINGDCFNLRLKNGTTLYLMDIEKSIHKTSDTTAFAKEAWVYVPHRGASLLIASQDKSPVAPMLESLFTTVKDRMEHPQLNSDIMNAIDAFMKDDVSDDVSDDPDMSLPF